MKVIPKYKLLLALPILIAIVFVIRFVHEPDLWWQLRTGEFILTHGSVPDKDVFSFTYDGVSWLNVKWGFEVIQALVVTSFGPEALPLPQIIANILLLIFGWGIIKNIDQQNTSTSAATTLASLLFLVGMSYRMNGRPELVSYTFTTCYLYIFTATNNGKTNWFYALIPAQILWANLHEAYGVGLIMVFVYLFSAWFGFYTAKVQKQDEKQGLIKKTVLGIIAWLGVAVHPSGLHMLWHPYEIFTQLSSNQFTQEIYSASNGAYWHMPAYLSLGITIIAVLYLYRIGRSNNRFKIQTLIAQVPLFYVLLFFAFFYLSLKSYRNLPFQFIITMPILALWFAKSLQNVTPKLQVFGVALVASLLYLSIVSNWFYKMWLPQEQYGWGVSTAKNPVGAARFIEKNQLKGNAFTDYLSSSYFLWHLQPDFKTFVDLRDLDIFEAEDIDIALTCCTNPTRRTATGAAIWDVVNQRYAFEYVALLNNPDFLPLHRYLIKNDTYKLVYADALSSVFVRNSPENKDLIAQYKMINFQPDAPMPSSVIPKIFNPFYHPPTQTDAVFEKTRTAYLKALALPLE